MGFVKGILAGATLGMAVGVMKSNEILGICKKGKRYIRKVKSYCM